MDNLVPNDQGGTVQIVVCSQFHRSTGSGRDWKDGRNKWTVVHVRMQRQASP
jgi:hypothetical protein